MCVHYWKVNKRKKKTYAVTYGQEIVLNLCCEPDSTWCHEDMLYQRNVTEVHDCLTLLASTCLHSFEMVYCVLFLQKWSFHTFKEVAKSLPVKPLLGFPILCYILGFCLRICLSCDFRSLKFLHFPLPQVAFLLAYSKQRRNDNACRN